MQSFSSTAARKRFSHVVRLARREVVQITHRNHPTLAVLDWESYESLIETLDILSDEDMIDKIRAGEVDYTSGKLLPWDEVKDGL